VEWQQRQEKRAREQEKLNRLEARMVQLAELTAVRRDYQPVEASQFVVDCGTKYVQRRGPDGAPGHSGAAATNLVTLSDREHARMEDCGVQGTLQVAGASGTLYRFTFVAVADGHGSVEIRADAWFGGYECAQTACSEIERLLAQRLPQFVTAVEADVVADGMARLQLPVAPGPGADLQACMADVNDLHGAVHRHLQDFHATLAKDVYGEAHAACMTMQNVTVPGGSGQASRVAVDAAVHMSSATPRQDATVAATAPHKMVLVLRKGNGSDLTRKRNRGPQAPAQHLVQAVLDAGCTLTLSIACEVFMPVVADDAPAEHAVAAAGAPSTADLRRTTFLATLAPSTADALGLSATTTYGVSRSLHTSNVGDTHAFQFQPDGSYLPLTTTDTIDNPAEVARLRHHGVYVHDVYFTCAVPILVRAQHALSSQWPTFTVSEQVSYQLDAYLAKHKGAREAVGRARANYMIAAAVHACASPFGEIGFHDDAAATVGGDGSRHDPRPVFVLDGTAIQSPFPKKPPRPGTRPRQIVYTGLHRPNGLMISRALGHGIMQHVGIVPVPHTFSLGPEADPLVQHPSTTPQHLLATPVVVSSDGLWDAAAKKRYDGSIANLCLTMARVAAASSHLDPSELAFALYRLSERQDVAPPVRRSSAAGAAATGQGSSSASDDGTASLETSYSTVDDLAGITLGDNLCMAVMKM
jgi:serine/threonine protein phosphatase PrpC